MKMQKSSGRAAALAIAASMLLLTLVRTQWSSASAERTGANAIVIPVPEECLDTWKRTRSSIEATTEATVSIVRFSKSVPQYPNLVGFVEIQNADRVSQEDLELFVGSAELGCYAASSISLPVEALGGSLQESLAAVKQRSKWPIYVTVEESKLIVRRRPPALSSGLI
jgi:hypothetical protein